jgi:hypothetical protein
MNQLKVTLTLIVLLCSVLSGFAQSYTPFNIDQIKRFQAADNAADNEYYYFPIQMLEYEDSIEIFQYMSSYTNYTDISGQYCEGWGGGFVPQADTSWLGRSFHWNNSTQKLQLKNRWNEIISFDFNTPLGDSTIFYEANNETFYLRFDDVVELNILGNISTIKVYSIHKFDNLGNPLPSELNEFQIKLSEEYGLVSFLNCRDFPQTEKGLELVGSENPSLGYYQITYGELFPWQPGDTLEYIGTNPGPLNGTGSLSQKIYTIEERIETTDSVWIYLNVTEQISTFPEGFEWSGPAYNIGYSNPIVFAKEKSFRNFPNHMTSYDGYTYSYDSVEYCSEMSKRFIQTGEFVNYCDSCFCFAPYDGFGNSYSIENYTERVGQTYKSTLSYGPFGGGSPVAQLQYSNVGGNSCGTFIPVFIEEVDEKISIGPNPVNDYLLIRAEKELDRIDVYTATGEHCLTKKIKGYNHQIPFQDANAGIYFVTLHFSGGSEKVIKIVKD